MMPMITGRLKIKGEKNPCPEEPTRRRIRILMKSQSSQGKTILCLEGGTQRLRDPLPGSYGNEPAQSGGGVRVLPTVIYGDTLTGDLASGA